MKRLSTLLVGFALMLATSVAHSAPIELFLNGGFEAGDFTGWTNGSTGGGLGWTINNGTFDPAGDGLALPPLVAVLMP